MPYIAINTTEKLSDAQKETVKAELGRLVTIIHGKTEANLFIDISDSRTMYRAGKSISGAFVDLRLWRQSEFEGKKQFTESALEMLSRELGLSKENIWLNIMELDTWGNNGTLMA